MCVCVCVCLSVCLSVCLCVSVDVIIIVPLCFMQDNDYVAAMKSVVTILAEYDSDQQFPAFGFGAKVPQYEGMSHCFPLNFNVDQPKVKGLKVNIIYRPWSSHQV